MRDRADRINDQLEDVQRLLRMYDEPPLNRFGDSPEIAELISRLKCEEERLTTLLRAAKRT